MARVVKNIDQLIQDMINGQYVKAKLWRRAIDKNKDIRQKFEMQGEYIKRFEEFSKAARKAHSNGNSTFNFEGQTYQPRSALRTAAAVSNRSHKDFGRANFKQQAYTLKKLFPELAEGQELGHKNISVLRASLSSVLAAMDTKDPRRPAIKALFVLASKIDQITEVGEMSFEDMLDSLERDAAKGFNVKAAYEKDVKLLKGIRGSLELEFEAKDINQYKGRLAGKVGELFRQVITDASFDLANHEGFSNIANIKGSPSMIEEITAQSLQLIDPTKKYAPGRKTKARSKTQTMSGPTVKTKRNKLSKAVAPSGPGRGKGVSSAPLELLGILNQQLPRVVANNMGSPKLNYVTGRFSSSVNVTDVTQTAQGFPSIGFTYRRNPYGVFESDPDRDPRKLIDLSIREVAAQFAIGRFYTRRV